VAGDTIRGSYDGAHDVLRQLAAEGIDFGHVAEQHEREGLARFETSWRFGEVAGYVGRAPIAVLGYLRSLVKARSVCCGCGVARTHISTVVPGQLLDPQQRAKRAAMEAPR
jgi:hypothetical protein